MPDPFSTFSFVDRIIDIEADSRARGCFAVPAGLPHFSPCLVAEAIGQLAAWVAMARDDFRRRPVAALAGEGRIVGRRQRQARSSSSASRSKTGMMTPSRTRGGLACGDVPVIELSHCVGALLPLEDFDAPEVARNRFATLCQAGAQPGRFRGVD